MEEGVSIENVLTIVCACVSVLELVGICLFICHNIVCLFCSYLNIGCLRCLESMKGAHTWLDGIKTCLLASIIVFFKRKKWKVKCCLRRAAVRAHSGVHCFWQEISKLPPLVVKRTVKSTKAAYFVFKTWGIFLLALASVSVSDSSMIRTTFNLFGGLLIFATMSSQKCNAESVVRGKAHARVGDVKTCIQIQHRQSVLREGGLRKKPLDRVTRCFTMKRGACVHSVAARNTGCEWFSNEP